MLLQKMLRKEMQANVMSRPGAIHRNSSCGASESFNWPVRHQVSVSLDFRCKSACSSHCCASDRGRSKRAEIAKDMAPEAGKRLKRPAVIWYNKI